MSEDIRKVLIIGSGVIGKSLKRLFENKEVDVILVKGTNFIEDLENIKDEPNLIIESVTENLKLKIKVLTHLANKFPNSIIGTTTSSLSINSLQKNLLNPHRFAGIHFMNPPAKIALVELIPGEKTSSQVIEVIETWLTNTLNRNVVKVNDRPGFILNSILFSFLNKAAHIQSETGLNPSSVDEMFKEVCGHSIGPLATLDLIGLDTSLVILQNLYSDESSLNLPPAPIIVKMVENGLLGRKSKRGFFDY
jgi:3-hydroxybutyryl-CoA dehydrogenase